MVVFLLALLFVSAVASAVVAAFALPHLRAGSPLLTDRGERVARRWHRRLGPVVKPAVNVIWPPLRPLAKRLARLTGRLTAPAMRRMRARLAPITRAIARAVEQGTAPPSPPAHSAAGAARADGGSTSASTDGEPSEPGVSGGLPETGSDAVGRLSAVIAPAPRSATSATVGAALTGPDR